MGHIYAKQSIWVIYLYVITTFDKYVSVVKAWGNDYVTFLFGMKFLIQLQ